MNTDLLVQAGWSPPHARRLAQILETPRSVRPLAVFDCDHTLLNGDISLFLLDHMDALHHTHWHSTYDHLLHTQGPKVAYPQILRWFAGYRPEAFASLARSVVEVARQSGAIRMRPEMNALLTALAACGWEVGVVSASPEILVKAVLQGAAIAFSHILGLRAACDAQGAMTEALEGFATFGEGKTEAIRATYGRVPDLCAGDSRSDAPMLRVAREALLVDLGDISLRAEALASGWMVHKG